MYIDPPRPENTKTSKNKGNFSSRNKSSLYPKKAISPMVMAICMANPEYFR
jgi:hypothetical protein